jgi:hypothetical protein
MVTERSWSAASAAGDIAHSETRANAGERGFIVMAVVERVVRTYV